MYIDGTDPNDDDDRHDGDEGDDGPLEPLFTVLQTETAFRQVPHEVRVSRQLFAYVCAERIITE